MFFVGPLDTGGPPEARQRTSLGAQLAPAATPTDQSVDKSGRFFGAGPRAWASAHSGWLLDSYRADGGKSNLKNYVHLPGGVPTKRINKEYQNCFPNLSEKIQFLELRFLAFPRGP